MKIAFLPIDNRPVCYAMPKMIAGINEDVEFYIPEKSFLGNLKKTADTGALMRWLVNLPKVDAIVISLDTLVYGGLIPSRRGKESFDDLKEKLGKLKKILLTKQAKIYAFSSIMRISNNNYNEEEKEYWSLYGEKIFRYSYETHKYGSAVTDVPKDILEDYLSTRKRNFEINKIFLNWQKEGIFETLIFSKDDCAQYGLNVIEAEELESMGGYTKTGADEIPLSLLARTIDKKLKICPVFLEQNCKNLISNYEDVSVEQSVKGQIELAGCCLSDYETADIVLYVNNFKNNQGEIVMKVPTESFSGSFELPQRPFMIADVRFANGADNNFVGEIFKNKINDKCFYGYSAWNTTANTLGSLICCAKFKFCSSKYNKSKFLDLQKIRFLDDWAYQANVRQELSVPDEDIVLEKMKPYEKKVADFLCADVEAKYTFPWERLFEVEVWV